MKVSDKHQEILLFVNASHLRKELVKSKVNNPGKKSSAIEEFVKSYRNGLIYEMIPEFLCSTCSTFKNELRLVFTDKNFLCNATNPNPLIAHYRSSIEPYFFKMNICES